MSDTYIPEPLFDDDEQPVLCPECGANAWCIFPLDRNDPAEVDVMCGTCGYDPLDDDGDITFIPDMDE